jgi:tellurite methyltransferase
MLDVASHTDTIAWPRPFPNTPASVPGRVIACNVLHHGDGMVADKLSTRFSVSSNQARCASAPCCPSGTATSAKGAKCADTFVVEAASDDKGHPHYYCDAAVLLQLHGGGFEVLLLRNGEQAPGAFHWKFIFERR